MRAASYYSTKSPRRRTGRAIVLSVLALVILLAAGVGGVGYYIINSGADTFYEGVFVDGIDLQGLAPAEAFDRVQAGVSEKVNRWRLSLYYSDTQSWEITGELINMQADVSEQINSAWMQGRTGSLIERVQAIWGLRTEPYMGYTSIQFNPYSLESMIGMIKTQLDVAPVDATRVSDPTRSPPFRYTDEQPGMELNAAALTAEVLGFTERVESASVSLRLDTVQPTVKTADLQSDIVRLSRARTPISTSSTPERNANVEIGCAKFNGLTIPPGAKVSFNDVVGQRTMENGWQQALEIKYGEYVMGYGGGICQVSSTLYNAIVESGLEVIDRSPHKLKVGYLDAGKDATVADRGTDFVFVNNTSAPIQILARVTKINRELYCEFEVFGAPDPSGYSYQLVSEIVRKIPFPQEPKRIADKEEKYTKYIGETYLVKGQNGYEANSFRVVLLNGTEISRTFIANDIYDPIVPKEYYGIKSKY